MRPRAGDLRHEVRIESGTAVQDSTGHVTQSWSEVDVVRAAIEPVGGREYFQAAAINEETTVRFRMNYISGLDTSYRLVDVETSEVYDIKNVINQDRLNNSLEIIATITNDETT